MIYALSFILVNRHTVGLSPLRQLAILAAGNVINSSRLFLFK